MSIALLFIVGLRGTKLGSLLHMLMDIKAHLISISTQSQKSLHVEWIESQDCQVSSSWLFILMLG